MGRPVFFQDSVQTSTGTDNTFLANHSMPSDVAWKCAWLSWYRSPFQPEIATGTLDGGTVQLYVSGAVVFQMRVHGQAPFTKSPYCVVLPWGDGLQFTVGQSCGWFLEDWNMQGYVSGGFIGGRV